MKRCEVTVTDGQGGRTALPGWATDVPGLVVWQEPDDPKCAWTLTHEASGLAIAAFTKRATANTVALELAMFGDWTRDESKIGKFPGAFEQVRALILDGEARAAHDAEEARLVRAAKKEAKANAVHDPSE